MEGLATGAREVTVLLKEGLEVPSFHRMKGRRIKIEVEGHRDCYNCYLSSKRCLARGKTRECQRLNSSPKTSWQTRLQGFLEEIKTNEQELWKEQMVTGDEIIEVVSLEEEVQRDGQEAEGMEASKTDNMELDEETRPAGIEFRGLKDQAKGHAGIMEWQGVLIGIVGLSKEEEVQLCKEFKMSVEVEGKVVIKGDGKSELLRKIWIGMKEVLQEEGALMVPIEEAPPTPVKEQAKTKLTVIQEARAKARQKLKELQTVISERQTRKKSAAASKAGSSMSVLELETKEEELERELGLPVEKMKDSKAELEYAEANLTSLERQAEEAQEDGVVAMGEHEKDKTNKGKEKNWIEAETYAKYSRCSTNTAKIARNEKELAASAALAAKDKLEEELLEVRKSRSAKEEDARRKKG